MYKKASATPPQKMASDKTGTRIMAIILATLVQDEARLNDLTDLRPNITWDTPQALDGGCQLAVMSARFSSGEPRQKWRISPRVGMTNDASAANGRSPLAAPYLASAAATPGQTDAFSLSRRNSRATYAPAPAVFPATKS